MIAILLKLVDMLVSPMVADVESLGRTLTTSSH